MAMTGEQARPPQGGSLHGASIRNAVDVSFHVSKSGVDRPTYELMQFIPLVVIILLTIVFYVWGQNEKRNRDVVVDQLATERAD